MIPTPCLSERDAKLQLIMSISRSQNALARILDSMADVSACSEETAHAFIQQADRITQFQQAMASMLANIELRRQYTGIPTAPWLNPDKGVALESFTRKQEADKRYGG